MEVVEASIMGRYRSVGILDTLPDNLFLQGRGCTEYKFNVVRVVPQPLHATFIPPVIYMVIVILRTI